MATVGAPKRPAPSLALEAAALAYAGAVAALKAEGAAVVADHKARTGSDFGSYVTPEASARMEPLVQARNAAEAALGRAAVALWKAERRRSGGGGRAR
jgi:hypothetical protein